jgi:hypothetical protein
MIIHVIQERSWGKAGDSRDESGKWPKASPVPLAMKALAVELAGDDDLTRKMIYRARKSLLESGVIREDGGGLEIETDVSRWRGRIDPKHYAYCMAGRTKQQVRKSQERPDKSAKSCHSEVTASEIACRSEVPDDHPGVTDRNFKVTPPIRNAGAERIREEEEEENTSPYPLAGNDAASLASDGEGKAESRLKAPGPEKPAGPRPPETLDELWAWTAVAVDESEDIRGKLAGWCAGYPVAWVHAGLMSAMAMARRGKFAGYVNSCLLRWHSKGGPDFSAGSPGSGPATGPKYWSGGVPPLTPELQEARSAKIREILARMPPPEPSLAVVPEAGPAPMSPQELADRSRSLREFALKLSANAPKRGARRA